VALGSGDAVPADYWHSVGRINLRRRGNFRSAP
jgi:hypothetical protein